jgi:O-antigen/teichoic acid export membrane protein
MSFLTQFSKTLSNRLLGPLMHGERGARRVRLAGLAIGANVVSKALGFVVLLYSTRVALTHLGTERFGIWSTIASIATLLSFMDLGLSNAFITHVAAFNAGNTRSRDFPKLISAGLMVLCGVGIIAALLLVGVSDLLPLGSLFKGIDPNVEAETRLTGYVFAILFGLSLPAQTIYKIYSGLQQGWITHTATGTGWLLSLVLIALAPRFDAPMWFYLFATFGIQQLMSMTLVGGLLRRRLLVRPTNVRQTFFTMERDALFEQGRYFFIIQFTWAIVWGSNQAILSSISGPTDAGTFSVLQRFFMAVLIGLAIINAPLWAMYADARAHSEVGYIRSLLKRSMAVTLVASLVGVFALLAAAPLILPVIVGNRLQLTHSALELMAVWTVLEACGNAFSMYLNGVGATRPQAIAATAYMLTSIPLKILAVRHFGLNGMLVVMSAAYVVCAVLPLLTIFRSECLSPAREPRGSLEKG